MDLGTNPGLVRARICAQNHFQNEFLNWRSKISMFFSLENLRIRNRIFKTDFQSSFGHKSGRFSARICAQNHFENRFSIFCIEISYILPKNRRYFRVEFSQHYSKRVLGTNPGQIRRYLGPKHEFL